MLHTLRTPGVLLATTLVLAASVLSSRPLSSDLDRARHAADVPLLGGDDDLAATATSVAAAARDHARASPVTAPARLDTHVASPDRGAHGDGPAPAQGAGLSVPIVVSEALLPGAPGLDRPDGVATFGLPFAMSAAVDVVEGRPALSVAGSDAYQFDVLDTWPDGSVRWALVSLQTDVVAGAPTSGLSIERGEGTSGQPPLASDLGDEYVLVDTGPLQFAVRKVGFNLLDAVLVDGEMLVEPGTGFGVVGKRADGGLVKPSASTIVTLERNGPARAVIRADGTLVSDEQTPLVDFTCRIVAERGSRDVEVTLTVRNANLERPFHLELSGVEIVVTSSPLGAQPLTARLAAPAGPLPLALDVSTDYVYLYQAQSSATITGLELASYRPHIPKIAPTVLTEQGYRIVRNAQIVESSGSPDVYPVRGFGSISGPAGAISVAVRHMPWLYPASIEMWGSGNVSAGVFTHRNAADYTFVWRQHESRTAAFSFSATGDAAPADLARRLEAPLSGRAADYAYYDETRVFPYRLVTVEQQELAYALMAVDAQVTTTNEAPALTRYLLASSAGGENNHANIERRLGEWLRHGYGGQLQKALADALYKCEWQIQRSDGFDDADDPGPLNAVTAGDEPFYSELFQSDDSHRYRDGIILAYHLTGDERFREALIDEAEILSEPYDNFFTRPMAQTLRSLALLAEFLDDDALRARLQERVAEMAELLIDDGGSAGWEAAPGLGVRGYYTHVDEVPEAPEVLHATRGFFAASLLPLGLYHAALELGRTSPVGQLAELRLLDIARYTRNELFPYSPDPFDRRLVYAYDLDALEVISFETFDFHPILLAMAEAHRLTGDDAYLTKGIEQIQSWAVHGSLPDIESRLDVQHFLHRLLVTQGAIEP